MALCFTEDFLNSLSDEAFIKWFGVSEVETATIDGIMADQGVGMALTVKNGVAKKTGMDYGKHLETKPVTGIVSTSKSVAGKEIASSASESKTLHPGVFTNGMSITVEGGRVMNLGNYETARVGVSITVPCDKESLEDAYNYATQWVSEKIEEAVKMAKE